MSRSFSIRCIPPGIWALCVISLLASIWGGSRFYHKEPVKPITAPPPDIAVIFIPYDTQGKLLEGLSLQANKELEMNKKLFRPIEHVPISKGGLRQSEPPGTVATLEFDYGNQRRTEVVTWQAGKTFSDWLKVQMPLNLKKIDSDYNPKEWDKIIKGLLSQSTDTISMYPVVFRVSSEHR